MPFVQANREEEAKKLQNFIDSNPGVRQHMEDWDKEYAFRKKMALARKQAGLLLITRSEAK